MVCLKRARHAQKDEEFFACKWSVEPRSGAPLLLIAGKRGLLKVLNCVTESLHWVRACWACCMQQDTQPHLLAAAR